MTPLRVHAPSATRLVVEVEGEAPVDLRREGADWVGEVPDGARYALRADGPADLRFRFDRQLVDPFATEVWFPADHRRAAARPGAPGNVGEAPLAVAASWPSPRPSQRTRRPLLVYEAHVRGLTRRRPRADAGTFRALVDELPRLAELGVSVLELMPVQQFDPGERNYWGYMPLALGAVHRQYAATDAPAEELAALVDAAHGHDIEVWLDVVFNHTTEEDEHGPTYNLRGLADADYYALRDDGGYVDDAGTGNIVDVTTEPARRLVTTSLDRFADLGVDGFRFDLAAVLTRQPGFVSELADWAERRDVRLIAEPWDLARYQLGRAFPDPRWAQWNGRFRDDIRGFLRGEGGLVAAVMQRVQGSPDLFDEPMQSVNFVTSHDGFTLYDLVAYDRKHNEANGWGGTDGHHDDRSWNCGWEGDDGVPDDVMALRRRQMRNAICLLLLSHGTPMIVAGDEFARTQRGNNNPYRLDDETSWVDWGRRERFADQETFVRRMMVLRAEHPVLWSAEPWADRVEWFGTDGTPDLGSHSRSLSWHVDGLYVMANMWWEPLTFTVQVPGRWQRVVDTSIDTPGRAGFVEAPEVCGSTVTVAARSIVVLVPAR